MRILVIDDDTIDARKMSESFDSQIAENSPVILAHNLQGAIQAMENAGREAMEHANLTAADIDLWVPHQANSRIIQDTAHRLGIPAARTVNVVDQYGNSSAASIPTALAHAVDCGKIQTGNVLLLTAAGAGMLSAAVVLRW